MTLTSAAGIISLLEEEDTQLKNFALSKLNDVVDDFWAEIADSIEKIEVLYEDAGFEYRQLSALVASKVYYHLGSYEDSLTFALGAGPLFDVNAISEYVDTTISKCIDHYIGLRVKIMASEDITIDPNLEDLVNRIINELFVNQAVGIAIEARRIDVFEKAITSSNNVEEMLAYSFKICMSVLENRQFRNEALRVIVRLYNQASKIDYLSVCQCLIYLDDPVSISTILTQLIQSNNQDDVLSAYQIAFDLVENASQQLLSKILKEFKTTLDANNTMEVENNVENTDSPSAEQTDESKADNQKSDSNEENRTQSSSEHSNMDKILEILRGDITIKLMSEFLFRKNRSDMQILKITKDYARNGMAHTATVIANAFMHYGTMSDTFLRDNLDWLGRAANWAKFTATASLGVIHKGNEKNSIKLMSHYLPKDNTSSNGMQSGGALYALGLIHANHGHGILSYLRNQLKEAASQPIRHGACLALGLAALGTANQDIYDDLYDCMIHDEAVTGEASGLAMGLVLIGRKSPEPLEKMITYLKETDHEKIERGLALGIALIMYGCLEEADIVIETLCGDENSNLRCSGMYTIGMAYCGSGSNKAIRQLLRVAVSDVNSDVRRAAVVSIGFVLVRSPEQCPSVVSLLAESYNPHVRYGAAMALGISCAGTGLKEAVNILEPMMHDSVNFVRQGALVAISMVLIQQTEATNSKAPTVREYFTKVIADKHEDSLAKFGAIIAQGIIDAGGRNATISLLTRSGHVRTESVVGLLVFSQFWFWFPYCHFLSLAFTPATVIALNSNLQMLKVDFKSNCKPSVFGYIPYIQPSKEKPKGKIPTAILSTTAKALARAKRGEDIKSAIKSERKTEEPMEVDTPSKTEAKPVEKELDWELLPNPARVLPAQLKYIEFPKADRYAPLKKSNKGGIVMMKDLTPGESQETLEPLPDVNIRSIDEEEEAEPPEPFEYEED
ncbi:26S proteasome non-ATPase regulatory subunit 1 [Trichoplax sp. H2]|nr:26S proteasome non-ATPase regulatory subunit 1 [Trichoplax sp. H2]|eukprot:RDD41259.1 26S proteasome non-ATPase regulatory subunit 1 [Trichoplax sp. H2]